MHKGNPVTDPAEGVILSLVLHRGNPVTDLAQWGSCHWSCTGGNHALVLNRVNPVTHPAQWGNPVTGPAQGGNPVTGPAQGVILSLVLCRRDPVTGPVQEGILSMVQLEYPRRGYPSSLPPPKQVTLRTVLLVWFPTWGLSCSANIFFCSLNFWRT